MDVSNFRRLFDAHAAFVWRVLQRHGVATRELDDGCQEVFLVVFRRIAEFDGQAALRTWLYSIAVRVAHGMRRRAFHRKELLGTAASEPMDQTDVFQNALQHEARQLLAAALSQLPRTRREVFVLYELEGMTVAEAASALGVPENTALYRLYSAREEVQEFVRRREARGQSDRNSLRARNRLVS
jgi:RNA polymerase sigma-70 factor (ECF subfamily)